MSSRTQQLITVCITIIFVGIGVGWYKERRIIEDTKISCLEKYTPAECRVLHGGTTRALFKAAEGVTK